MDIPAQELAKIKSEIKKEVGRQYTDKAAKTTRKAPSIAITKAGSLPAHLVSKLPDLCHYFPFILISSGLATLKPMEKSPGVPISLFDYQKRMYSACDAIVAEAIQAGFNVTHSEVQEIIKRFQRHDRCIKYFGKGEAVHWGVKDVMEKIEPPNCKKCGTKMKPDDTDHRTTGLYFQYFKCNKCGDVIRIAKQIKTQQTL